MGFLIVFIGAGLGGACRHGINLAVARWLGVAFPYGTLTVNIVGCFLMGIIAGWWALSLPQSARLFLTTGVLGGFTTFSAFSLDVALLWKQGEFGAAVLYATASVALSIAALFLGLVLVRMFQAGTTTWGS